MSERKKKIKKKEVFSMAEKKERKSLEELFAEYNADNTKRPRINQIDIVEAIVYAKKIEDSEFVAEAKKRQLFKDGKGIGFATSDKKELRQMFVDKYFPKIQKTPKEKNPTKKEIEASKISELLK